MPVVASLLSPNIQDNTTLNYVFTRINGDITATGNNSLVIFYPQGLLNFKKKIIIIKKGFVINIKKMAIQIDSTKITLDKLHHIPLFNMLVINLPSTLTGPAIDHTLTLGYIINPISVVAGGTFSLYTTNSGDFYESSSYSIPSLVVGSFQSSELKVDNKQCAFPFANYSISFTTSKSIPSGSLIKVTFPGGFTFYLTLASCKNFNNNLQGANNIIIIS